MSIENGDVEIGITGNAEGLTAEFGHVTEALNGLKATIAQLSGVMAQNATAAQGVAATMTRVARANTDATSAMEKFNAFLQRQQFALRATTEQLKAYDLGLDQAAAAASPFLATLEASRAALDAETVAAKKNAEAMAARSEINAAASQADFNKSLGVKDNPADSARIQGQVNGSAFEEMFKREDAAAKEAAEAMAARADIIAVNSQAEINALLGVGAAAAKSAKESAAAFKEALDAQDAYAARIQAVKDKLDPAAVASRKLADETTFLNEAVKTGALTEAEGAAALKLTEEGLKKVGAASGGAHTGISGLVRETMVLFREMSRGDTSRMAGSFTIWAQRLQAALPSVAALTIGLGAVAVAAGLVAYEIHVGSQEVVDLQNSLVATGNAAGMTTGQFYAMGDRIHQATNASVSSVRALEMQLIRTGKVGSNSMELMITDAEELARAMGEKPAEALKTLEGLTDDVATSSANLNKELHFLTVAQWLQIRAMQEAGDKEGALRTALDDLKTHLAGVTQNTGFFEQALRHVIDQWNVFTNMLQSIGRVETAAEKMAKLQAMLNNPANKNAKLFDNGQGLLVPKEQIEQQIADLGRVVQRQNDAVQVKAAATKVDQDAIGIIQEFGKKQGDLDTVQQKRAETLELIKQKQLELNAATDTGKRKELQDSIDALNDAKKGEDNRIKQLQKQIAGPKGPKAKGVATPLDDDRTALSKQIADAKAYGDQALQIELDFWAKKVAAATKGTTEYDAAVRSLNKVKQDQALLQLNLDATVARDAADLARSRVEAAAQAATDEIDLQIDAKKFDLQNQKGFTADNLKALKDLYARRLDIVNQATRDELAAALKALDAQQALDHARGNSVAEQRDADERVRIAADADAQIAVNSAKSAKDVQKAQQEALKQQVDDYRQSIGRIADTMRTNIEGLIESTKSWRDVWIDAQRTMLDNALRFGQKWLTDFLAQKRQEVLAHQMANTAKTESDRTAATTSGQISFKSAIAQIGNDARVAAGAAFKATAGIPIIGPALAPVAAAAAFAGTLAFESGVVPFSAAGGMGAVPYDNAPFLLHKNEMVLPASLATPLRSMLTMGQGGGSGATTNNSSVGGDTFHIHTHKGMSVDDVVDAITKAKRRGKFGYA